MIGWAASLRLPASQAPPLAAANLVAIQNGYWDYVLTAIAMVPFVVALRRFAMAHGAGGTPVDAMAAFAKPTLANLYVGTPDPAIRATIEINYMMLNVYARGVGELLGLQLVSGLCLISLGLVS